MFSDVPVHAAASYGRVSRAMHSDSSRRIRKKATLTRGPNIRDMRIQRGGGQDGDGDGDLDKVDAAQYASGIARDEYTALGIGGDPAKVDISDDPDFFIARNCRDIDRFAMSHP